MKVFHILLAIIILSSSASAFIVSSASQCCKDVESNPEILNSKECCNYSTNVTSCNTCYDQATADYDKAIQSKINTLTFFNTIFLIYLAFLSLIPILAIYFITNEIVKKRRGKELLNKKINKSLKILFYIALIMGFLLLPLYLL